MCRAAVQSDLIEATVYCGFAYSALASFRIGRITLNCLPKGFVAKLSISCAPLCPTFYRALFSMPNRRYLWLRGRDAKIDFLRSFKGIGPS